MSIAEVIPTIREVVAMLAIIGSAIAAIFVYFHLSFTCDMPADITAMDRWSQGIAPYQDRDSEFDSIRNNVCRYLGAVSKIYVHS